MSPGPYGVKTIIRDRYDFFSEPLMPWPLLLLGAALVLAGIGLRTTERR
jgi:hypothetical protein